MRKFKKLIITLMMIILVYIGYVLSLYYDKEGSTHLFVWIFPYDEIYLHHIPDGYLLPKIIVQDFNGKEVMRFNLSQKNR